MSENDDLTNVVFGKLTALSRCPEKSSDNRVQWYCKCSCGNCEIITVTGKSLVSGNTKSCGCQRWITMQSTNRTHGMSHLLEYRVWKAIKERCYYPKHVSYSNYGGRGITVCDEWKDSFETFYKDMGPRPSLRHSIERRKVDESYSKDNCFWATPIEQANNTRKNIFYTHQGVSRTLAGWCRELNLSYGTIYARINQHNWSFEKAITTP